MQSCGEDRHIDTRVSYLSEGGHVGYTSQESVQIGRTRYHQAPVWPKPNVPGPWADGCADDVLLFTELVNGAGAIPDNLLRLVPKAMKDSSAGLMVVHHLNSRVCTISEAATTVRQQQQCRKKSSEHKRQYWGTRGTCWHLWWQSGCLGEAER